MSGSSRFRPSFQQLLADAERGRFDIVVCEALDRLGRKLSDIADLFDRLSFLGIKMHAVNAGEVTALHIGMLGTMSQLFIADLREKTWRGQLGRARKGRVPGGCAYGYDVVGAAKDGKSEGGLRRINPEEARVVRHIFEEYARGRSPRDIAKALNAERILGPDGRAWGDTTIRGQVGRGTGILNNTSTSAGWSGTGSPM
jgi:DNA invertase Pin-like site-specific DNA recombinase